MKFKRMRVNGGNSHDSLKVASSECLSNGNSNKCRCGGHPSQWMNVYMLLFMYVGNVTQLALCNVGWLTTWEIVILAPDPTVFAEASLV